MRPDIIYNLHDSSITLISIGPAKEASITVDLYPIFYPEKSRIILRFEGIFNFDKFKVYLEEILNDGDIEHETYDETYFGCRIDTFQYDTKKESTDHNLWFFFETDWNGKIHIHCTNMTMNLIQK